MDNVPGSNSDQPMFAMSGDGVDDVHIPSVFLYSREKDILMKAISNDPDLEVYNALLTYYICVTYNNQFYIQSKILSKKLKNLFCVCLG